MNRIEMRFGPYAILTIELTDQMVMDRKHCKEDAEKPYSCYSCDGCSLNYDILGHRICELVPVEVELDRQMQEAENETD